MPILTFNFKCINLGTLIIFNLKQISFLLLNIVIFISGFSCFKTAISDQSSSQNVDFLVKQGKIFWEQRTNLSSFDKADHFISLAYQKRPTDYELAILMSKIKFFRAYFLEDDPFIKDTLYLEASKICKNIIINHPEFTSNYNGSIEDTTTKLMAAIASTPNSLIPALYWWAVNQARYLNRKPALERINQRELLEVIMNRVLTIEPGFDSSGPYRFFGSLYTRIPGIELSQSKTYFDQALQANPEFLGNYVLMAEHYHQKAGNKEKFHQSLVKVIETNLTNHPELMTDNFFYQERAKQLLKNESLLFE